MTKTETIISIRCDAEKTRQHLSHDELKQLKETTNIADCTIYQKSEVWLVKFGDIILYDETAHPIPAYHYFEEALHYMNAEKREDWKTVEALITLRNALRETTAQGTGAFDDFAEKSFLSHSDYQSFLTIARHYDKQHHGCVTF